MSVKYVGLLKLKKTNFEKASFYLSYIKNTFVCGVLSGNRLEGSQILLPRHLDFKESLPAPMREVLFPY